MRSPQFAMSQYVFLPRGIGFDGVQAVIVGRSEHIDREPHYDVRWLDQRGQIAAGCIPLGGALTHAQLVHAWDRAEDALDEHERVLRERHRGGLGPGTDRICACRGGLCLARTLPEIAQGQVAPNSIAPDAIAQDIIAADAGGRPCAAAASAGGPVAAPVRRQGDGAAGKDAHIGTQMDACRAAQHDAPACIVTAQRDAAGLPFFADARAA